MKAYLVTDQYIHFSDEHYYNWDMSCENLVSIFKNIEEARTEKERLDFIKFKELYEDRPITELVDGSKIDWGTVDRSKYHAIMGKEFQLKQISDEELKKIRDLYLEVLKVDLLSFYMIVEIEID